VLRYVQRTGEPLVAVDAAAERLDAVRLIAGQLAVSLDTAESVLRVTVRDDGVGGADLTGGTGLVGLKDRVEALGGRILVDSSRGAGTTLCVDLPLATGDATSPRA
jgi:glucose-6-phosphate-specific signal transduction histidine kinase